MRDNYNTAVLGSKVALVPFRMEHTSIYMRWMQDPYIREMTASEDLEMNTLADAEALRNSVLEDHNNCTFLIAERVDNTQLRLIGDVNLFIRSNEDDAVVEAEVNIMIGESSARRKGLAKEALHLAFLYAIEHHKVESLIARISDSNVASINLFQRKLNWPVESHSSVFEETTFKMAVQPEVVAELRSGVDGYEVSHDYDGFSFVFLM